MSRVLHVIGSPRGANSVSNQLAAAFFEAAKAKDARLEIDTLDVWAEELPTFAGEAAAGKLKSMSGVPLPEAEQAAYSQVLGYIARLKAADKVVISSGMWNLGVPYRLKHWIDLVVQAGHTFGFDPMRGYFGLLTGRPMQLLLSTGSDYTEAPLSQMDMHGPYLRTIFGFLGFEDIREVTAGCTMYPPEVALPMVQRAVASAREAGAAF